MSLDFVYIDNEDLLKRESVHWKSARSVGVDVEFENNLHHYGIYTSIIQLSTEKKNWIIDAMRLKEIQPVAEMLENPEVQVIFHDASFDLRILHYEFSCRPKNVFDTQVAALLLGKSKLGLDALLKEYFDVSKNQKYQRADWTKRPLSTEMLSYAVVDSAYLIPLRDKLSDELEMLGRLHWMREEIALIEKNEITHREPAYFNMKGVMQMSDSERAILRRLYILRERVAKKLDRPPYFILSPKMLASLSTNPPKGIDGWKRLRGVHPFVRSYADVFHREVIRARREKVHIPKQYKPKKRHVPNQDKRLIEIMEKRDRIAAKLGVAKYLIMSKSQVEEVVSTGTLDCLKGWQRDIWEKN